MAGTLRIKLCKREVPREPLPGPPKLRVEFASEDEFRLECSQNVSKGGIFVPTCEPFELRQQVSVELAVIPLDRSVVLEGEVVHRISEELAEAGAVPGVAVQFLLEPAELRSQLESFAPLPSASIDERVEQTGRRSAPRSRARLQVQVEIDGRWLDGHTRNISSSGILVALPSASVAVGHEVGVRLLKSRNSGSMEVRGVVARRSQGTGETCFGIEFRVDEADRDPLEQFIGRVRSTVHNRRLGGINGPIADLGMERLLGMFGSCAPEGTLTLMRGSEEGYVTIDHGLLCAQLGDLQGRDALLAMLAWREGSFEFEALLEDGLVSGEGLRLSELLDDASPFVAPVEEREPS